MALTRSKGARKPVEKSFTSETKIKENKAVSLPERGEVAALQKGLISAKTGSPRQAPEPEKKQTDGGNKYVVKEGDTLWGVASKYAVSLKDLKALNNMKSDSLYAGSVLVVPNTEVNKTLDNETVKNETITEGYIDNGQMPFKPQTGQKSEIAGHPLGGTDNSKEISKEFLQQSPQKYYQEYLNDEQASPQDVKRAEVIEQTRRSTIASNKKGVIDASPMSGKGSITAITAIETKSQEIAQGKIVEERILAKEQEKAGEKSKAGIELPYIEEKSGEGIRSRLWNSNRSVLGPE